MRLLFFLLAEISVLYYSASVKPEDATKATRVSKKHEIISFGGYEYRKAGVSESGSTQFWNCPRARCNGRAHSPIDTELLTIKTNHNHMPDNDQPVVRETLNYVDKMAKIEELKPKNIITLAKESLTDEQSVKIPSHNALRQRIQIRRFLPETKLVNAELLADVRFEGIYTKDRKGNQFLFYDSRINYPSRPPIIIFSTAEGQQRLKNYNNWAGDGTFKVASKNFLQLYVISVIIDGSVAIPGAFALLEKKDAMTYKRLFYVMKKKLGDFHPATFITDFEQAQKVAAREVWDHLDHRLCFFHLSQSVFRKLKHQKLLDYYIENDEFKKIIRSLPALAYFKVDQVEAAFNVINDTCEDENADVILTYFKHTYIKTSIGNTAPFPIHTWNHHESIIRDLAKTNNGIESFNLQLRQHFVNHHPKLSRLIQALRSEELIAQDKMRQLTLLPARGPSYRKRPPNSIKFDKDLKKLVQKFDLEHPDPTAEDMQKHLKDIQYVLLQKKIHEYEELSSPTASENEEEEDEGYEENVPQSQQDTPQSSLEINPEDEPE